MFGLLHALSDNQLSLQMPLSFLPVYCIPEVSCLWSQCPLAQLREG